MKRSTTIIPEGSKGTIMLTWLRRKWCLAFVVVLGDLVWQGTPIAAASEPAGKPGLRISGRVLDAETGERIDQCRMVPTSVYRDDAKDVTWQTQYLKDFTDGRFLYETDRPWDKTRLRIEAEGYQPATTRVVNKGEVVELDVKLERQIFAGVVRLPDGKPAAKAQLALASWTNEIKVQSSELSYSGHGEKLRKVVETDEQGRFVMPAEVDPWVVVVAHQAGYAEVASPNQSLARRTPVGQELADIPQDTAVIELQPWGRVEGRVLAGDKPVVGAKYWVYRARSDNVHVDASHRVVTDADGRFIVEQLPPGPFGMCQRYANGSDGQSSHFISGLLVRFDIPAGQTMNLELGGRGRTLIGKLALPEGFPHKVDWSKVRLQVSLQGPHFGGRFGGNDESGTLWSQFLQTDEGRRYGRKNVAIAADGAFRIEGLPAAEYEFTAIADGEAVLDDQNPDGHMLRGSEKKAVPAAVSADAAPAIDLGTIALKVLAVPQKPAAANPANHAAVEVPEPTAWGPTNHGLRARVIPVLSSMSEDAIDPVKRVTKFETPDDVAFIVELENVSGQPITLAETRYGASYGESKGKANSDWFGQFLFAIDYQDANGKRFERPDVQIVDPILPVGGTLATTLEPRKSLRMLLRPARWRSVFSQRPLVGRQRAVVRYLGISEKARETLRKFENKASLLDAVAGDVLAPAVEFEVRGTGFQPVGKGLEPVARTAEKNESTAQVADGLEAYSTLVWGPPTNGLRAGLEVLPENKQTLPSHGTKLTFKLHVHNVGEQPVSLASGMWLSEMPLTATNDKGESVPLGATFYSGITPVVRVALKPQQVVSFDAGNLGLAITKERAEKFEHVTHRTLVAPSGKYSLQATERFGLSFKMEDGEGKTLAPLDGDWKGELKSGVTALEITNEVIEARSSMP